MRVLVCTVVHHTTDARIFRREIGALLDAGIEVTAVAPWPADTASTEQYRKVPIPRAQGRRRLAALRAARARIRELAPDHDILIVHDPELLVVLPWADLRRAAIRVIWDVHEDLGAALSMKTYLPSFVRRVLVPLVRLLERWAEHRVSLLLAESAYQQRFAMPHPVVLNLPLVPAQQPQAQRIRQAIYVGSITRARGLDLLLGIAPLLAPHGISMRLIGEAPDADDAARIAACPNVVWAGALPNVEAMRAVEESMVGLALLTDQPNYRHSMPTKILEYMAGGTPVVSTPLPLSRLVLGDDGVLLPSFDVTPQAVADEIVRLCDDVTLWERSSTAGYRRVLADFNWNVAKHDFVAAVSRS